ncbi:MAG: hypothetical protein OEX03_00880 [Gammaproteobacteria bacterium]|nr:hypothetical protein [Gammaproteobacteria bacterium]
MKTEIHSKLDETVKCYRLGNDAKASELFGCMIELFLEELQKIQDFESINSINLLLGHMLESQSKGNYLYLADLLEYELKKILDNIKY